MIEPGVIFESPIASLQDLRCRVQVRLCLDGSIQQRHVWYRDHAGDHDPPRVDRWIASYTRKPALAFRDLTPAADQQDELTVLIEALRQIEAGHNDARGLAAQALARAGL